MGVCGILFALLSVDSSLIGFYRLPATLRQFSPMPMLPFSLRVTDPFCVDPRLQQSCAQVRDLRFKLLSGHRFQGRFRYSRHTIVIAIHIRGDGITAIGKNVTDRGINLRSDQRQPA